MRRICVTSIKISKTGLATTRVSISGLSLLVCCHDGFQAVLWRLALVTRCHQLPERSFSLRNRQIPLCARCTGILIGAVLVPLYVVDLRIASLLIALMLVDGITQALKFRTSRNWIRFLTGLGFAISCGGFLEKGVQLLWKM